MCLCASDWNYLCKNFPCLGLGEPCNGDLIKLLLLLGDGLCFDSASDWFSSSSLIDGSTFDGPISDSAFTKQLQEKRKQKNRINDVLALIAYLLDWRIKITQNSTHYLARAINKSSQSKRKQEKHSARLTAERIKQNRKVYLLRFHSPHAYWMLNHVGYRWQILADIPDTGATLRPNRPRVYILDRNR